MAENNLKKYMNRELSWLSFNERVLQEAADSTVPLIERLKFMGIFSSNLDEFFRVRVGTMKRMVDAGVNSKVFFGETPKKILNDIQKKVLILNAKFDELSEQLQNELKKEDIYIINEKELSDSQEKFVKSYFQQQVRPRLVPIMLDSVPAFPYLKDTVIYLAVHMILDSNSPETIYALIEVPATVLPRFIVLPKIEKRNYIIMLDDVIRFGLNEIFSIFNFKSLSAYAIKFTRDAELDIDDDVTKSHFEKIAKSVKKREKGQPVRVAYDRDIPRDLFKFILDQNNMSDFENLIPRGRYHNSRDFMKFPNVKSKNLEYRKTIPLEHKQLRNKKSIFEAIKEKDILLHYPYQSYNYVIDMLREAAIDPKVRSIKITLYRLAENSNVINALINASLNGKDVTVNIELQARFDEEANIYWTRKLEEIGIRIIHGVPGLKVHAKLFLISREEGDKIVHFASIGTGNFNESTAKIYGDHSLLTCDKHIINEVNKVFKFLKNNFKTHTYKHLLVAPFNMRKKFTKLIKNEIKNAKEGKDAYIYVKLNSLVDQSYINLLYKASRAGVKIKMIIRGICSLKPGIPGLSDNIEVFSIVDKYLEHSRIMIFCNSGKEKYFISSADWMIRNLDNRVEVATPIFDEDIQKELRTYMDIQFRDGVKARIINEDQDNQYRTLESKDAVRAQEALYTYLKKTHHAESSSS